MVAEMKEDIEHRKNVYGLKSKDRHLLKSLPLMRAYFELLERDGNLEPTKPVVYKLLEEIIRARTADPVGYKSINYRLIDDKKFEVINNNETATVLPSASSSFSQQSQPLLQQKGG